MKEEEIRPAKIFDEYLRLAREDAINFFSTTDRQYCNCPACDEKGLPAFRKLSFDYECCPKCFTIFVNPRPKANAFLRYYRESPSSKYWATTFYKKTEKTRREKLWRPKALMIANIVKKYASINLQCVDIGGGYGIFAEEYEKISGNKVLVIEPGPFLARVCRKKGLLVLESFLENIERRNLGEKPKVFVSFELFEHLHDPYKFLCHLLALMTCGDLFIFTTLSGVGLDIQALWENSKSVSPPHHLNFINPTAAKVLLKRSGFTVLETSTPGMLDIDILCKYPHLIKDRFWKTFAAQSTDQEKKSMQVSLAENGLSSHMLVVAQKQNKM